MIRILLKNFKYFVLFIIFIFGILLNSFLFCSPLKINDYKSVLEKFVDSNGFVDYQGLKNDRKKLVSFSNSLENYTFEEYSRLQKNEKLIFWINVYNFSLLNIATEKYPINRKFYYLFLYPEKNIKNLGDLEKFKIKIFGDSKTLRDIILKIIELDNLNNSGVQKNSKNARAIFALTFLTKDSANMRNSLYIPDLLNRDLDEQVRKFVFNEKNYRLDKKIGVLYLSGFFKKYSNFFTNKNKDLNEKLTDEENKIITFLLDFVLLDDKDYLQNAYYKVVFKEYDYSLNDIKKV
jgi:hypothetical protein